MWRGRDAIRGGFGRWLSQVRIVDEKLTTEDVLVAGDVAVETGTIDSRVQPKGGSEVNDRGKYMTVWKRQADGSWKIARDIYNASPAK
jgi:ketosteroid isomerase-like protein